MSSGRGFRSRCRAGVITGLLVLAAAAGLARMASASTLIADLSRHAIRITTGFAGAELLLFGVKDGPGDVIVVVRGPPSEVVVRRKERVVGVWVNTERITFENVPTFYHVAGTERFAGALPRDVLAENGIGARYLTLSPMTDDLSPQLRDAFSDALVRSKERERLFSARVGEIDLIEGRLFRTTVDFPATVPTGTYRVDVYHLVDGWVRDATSTPLIIAKAGFEAALFAFAHDQPAAYGAIAILVALMAGWLAGAMFRKT